MIWLRRIAATLLALGVVVLIALAIWSLVPARTAAIAGQASIAEIERIELGGFEQAVLLRGNDRENPALLYLHGGPGGAFMPVASYYSDELEQHFVVAHLDQRGAGASCREVDWSTVTLEQAVSDAVELSEKLSKRFGDDGKVFLLGHSWGSVVGALAAARRPDLFYAYVGLGQVVNGRRNEEISYDWVVEQARNHNDAEALAELAGIQPPYTRETLSLQRRWLNHYNGSIYAVESAKPALWPLLFGSEYSLATRVRWPGCFLGSLDAMWSEIDAIDFPVQIPRLDVPVFFFTGREDWNAPFALVEEWAAELEAPHVEIVWFDQAGHMIPVENPLDFQRALVEKLRPIAD